ncbi:MAG: hypothetical protein AVDCRST_MAG20-2693 [uncultured Acidimicrobiales bacterium]|uniref:Uncharacterized protein n=2 Tax=Actinomycetota TaxID=201174 RepID=A0A6J4IX16_9ACTN|nr:MAG: hypothetical protein AVDCRST_MAG20-2693 [uncultured Acidimicrobiales bacterium]
MSGPLDPDFQRELHEHANGSLMWPLPGLLLTYVVGPLVGLGPKAWRLLGRAPRG